MTSTANTFLKQIQQGDQVHDWKHASDLFVANNYELVPKNTFLYHVYFKFGDGIKINNGAINPTKQAELGMLVKQVSLPKFTVETKTLNAYNRPNIVQTKIRYDPVNITFHDDSADLVRNFWYDYYSYYYRDSDYGNSNGVNDIMPQIHDELTHDRQKKDWGYTIRGSKQDTPLKTPYLKSIHIFSLHQKKFSEYVLVNPIIKSFQHGEHNATGTTEIMSHQMSVEYETVLYAYGTVSPNTVSGFGDIHYDKSPSPLTPAGGGTQSILGPGGIVDMVTEISQDLTNGDIGAAIFKGARDINGLKGANLKAMAKTEAVSLTKNILTGSNPFGSIAIPSVSSLLNGNTFKKG